MWGKSFAMAAPWSIEFNKNFFIWIKNKFFKVFADSNFNGLIVGFGNRSRFKILLDFASLNFSDKSWKFFFAWCSLKEIFVLLFSKIENGWGIFCINSEIFSKSVEQTMTVTWVRDSENDIGASFIELFECLSGCGWFFIVRCEEEKSRSFLLENLLNCGVIEWDNLSFNDQQNTKKC